MVLNILAPSNKTTISLSIYLTGFFDRGPVKARIFLFMIISIVFPSVSGGPASAAEKIDAANYTILGLEIGESAWHDVQSKFGFALAFGDETDPEAQQMCFISNRDEALLLLKFKHNRLRRLRLQSNKNQFYKWHFCTESNQVSKYTATASGIKLGMRENDIKAILGAPTEESNTRLQYRFRNPQKTAIIEIQADLGNKRLVSLDLSTLMN